MKHQISNSCRGKSEKSLISRQETKQFESKNQKCLIWCEKVSVNANQSRRQNIQICHFQVLKKRNKNSIHLLSLNNKWATFCFYRTKVCKWVVHIKVIYSWLLVRIPWWFCLANCINVSSIPKNIKILFGLCERTKHTDISSK